MYFLDMEVFKKSHSLTLFVYEITENFPSNKLMSLISQMQRAAISIPANLMEGVSRKSTKEFLRYVNISIGSASELFYYFYLSKDLRYITEELFNSYENLNTEVLKLLYGLRRSLVQKLQTD